MKCGHTEYVAETASGDLIVAPCRPCERAESRREKRRQWSDDDRRDYWDELAALRAQRDDGIHDGADGW